MVSGGRARWPPRRQHGKKPDQCPRCGKYSYATEDAATERAQAMVTDEAPATAYECELGGVWHLTSHGKTPHPRPRVERPAPLTHNLGAALRAAGWQTPVR
jgi:hypothetical protein